MSYIQRGKVCLFQVGGGFTCRATNREGQIRIQVRLERYEFTVYFCPTTLTVKEIQTYTAHRLLLWVKNCESQIQEFIEERG